MKTATATKVSVVYDAGVEIGRRVQTPKRRYTHALMRRAENFTRVQRRHERRRALDFELAALLNAELDAATPAVRRAGESGSGKILVQPPVPLRPFIDPVYAAADFKTDAVSKYLAGVRKALNAVHDRLAESQLILTQLSDGSYDFQSAKVLRFAGSRVGAQAYMRAEAALEPYDLMGLAIVNTVEVDCVN